MPDHDPTPTPGPEPTPGATDATPGFWPLDPTSHRRWMVRNRIEGAVFDLVREFDGPDAIRMPDHSDPWHHRAEPDPLSAIRAALDLRAATRDVLGEHIARARGAGHSWAALAPVLGVEHAAEEADLSPGEAAFNLAATGEPAGWPPADRRWSQLRNPTTRWTCTACGARITDHGPYDPHPDAAEHGHTPGCARHTAALAAWDDDLQAVWDDDEDGA